MNDPQNVKAVFTLDANGFPVDCQLIAAHQECYPGVTWAEVFADVRVLNKEDLPELVDGHWQCGRCKTEFTSLGRCQLCWPTADDSAPTTGGPVDYYFPEGCRCYIREDPEYGEQYIRPPGGCPLHSCAGCSGNGEHADHCAMSRLNLLTDWHGKRHD